MGSQSQGCYIEYNSLITHYYSGSITIVRTSVDVSTASKCVTGIYTSNYNVTFYDMDYNDVPYTTEYAVKLINLYVISRYSPSILNSIRTNASLMPTAISPSLLPTCGKLSYHFHNHTVFCYNIGIEDKEPLPVIFIGNFVYIKCSVVIVISFL